ncbi:hypothetical protein BGZ63DRAFT_395380 [Mariannaea sp. PMI_226]|nr:hypothetical protein BGZ63DRAFT_395380 [Mariannaea sp. PMI_226]
MMEPISDHTVQEALSLIENQPGLPHPSGPLLESFISKALHPPAAAAHVLCCCRSGTDRKAELLALVSDWTFIVESVTKYATPPAVLDDTVQARIVQRDGSRCCITGKASGFGDPLVVVPVLPIPSRWLNCESRISEMLCAFFGARYRDWWLSYTQRPERMYPCFSHWLVRKSAAAVFRRGLVKLDRLQPSTIEYRISPCLIGTLEGMIEVAGSFPLLGDHSRSGIPKVDARFIGTHARLAPSIQWLEVEKQITKDEQAQPSSTTSCALLRGRTYTLWYQSLFLTMCLKAWLIVPKPGRIAAYKLLQKAGQYLYGRSSAFSIQRLPFGLYLKYTSAGELRNGLNALNMIRQYTSISVPFGLDLISVFTTEQALTDDEDVQDRENGYLLTSRVPGFPLAHARDMLSDRDCSEVATWMQDAITQLRAIPRVGDDQDIICNSLGEACRDPRIHDANPVGPFEDETAFSQYLRYSDDPARRGHKTVFTHADLNLRNILVDRVARPERTRGWQVVGIVDWENSGFYPEYWDCTKAQFESWQYDGRWRKILYDIFRPFGDYSKELELEQRSWREGDGA